MRAYTLFFQIMTAVNFRPLRTVTVKLSYLEPSCICQKNAEAFSRLEDAYRDGRYVISYTRKARHYNDG